MSLTDPRNPNKTIQQKPESELDHFDMDEQYRDVKMPTVYSFADEAAQKKMNIKKIRPTLQHVITTEQFNIIDMQVYDAENEEVICSIAVYTINPHSQTLPLKVDSPVKDNKNKLLDKRLMYYVLTGKGSINVEGFAKPIYTGDIFPVEESVRHTFVNAYDEGMTIQCMYDGYLDLRDKYKPNRKRMDDAKESRREIFNAQTQQIEERPVYTHTTIQPPPKPTINRTMKRPDVKKVSETKNEIKDDTIFEAETTSDKKFA
jgi:mannose-6-phosphate isomerase-like protein (cupin superfamily)